LTDPHPALDLFGVGWRLGATLFFVLLNGFFVATEFALVKVRESRISQLTRDGSGRAAAVQHILQHLDRYLSACQLGITLASLALGALGEPAVSVLLIGAAEALGLPVSAQTSWVPYVSIALAFTVITVLHMTVGEQAPKMWALRRAEGISLATSGPLRLFTWTFGPFIVAINAISNWILGLLGLPSELGHETSLSAEEIRSVLSLSANAGHITDRQLEMTENVFRLIDLEVRHIVVPRVEIEFLSLPTPLEESLERIRASGHSRFPLCEVGLDSVVGILHTKDILDATLSGVTPDLAALAREPLLVPDTMPLSGFLSELQAHRQHCAVVLDEHGSAMGLAFREDALEEIVGPLGDEFDSDDRGIQQIEGGAWELPGRTPLPEVESRLGIDLTDEPEGEDTIGGHITARLGRLPKRGATVQIAGWVATVVEATPRRVARVRLRPVRPETVEEGGESAD
jgi:CBS domain containing-hemolysin-like protein